jgi:hypothetical protein
MTAACPCCGRPGRAGVRTTRTPRRRRRAVDTVEYLAFVRRIHRALSRRVGDDADLEALAELVALIDDLEGHVIDAVARLRHDPVWPASWADIGRAFGIDRRTAHERYSKVGGRRRPGGQPGEWR